MLYLNEFINDLKLFLWELEDCNSREGLKKIKENINKSVEKLNKSPDNDYSDIGQSITPVKFMFGSVSFRQEIEFSMNKIKKAINKLNEMVEENVTTQSPDLPLSNRQGRPVSNRQGRHDAEGKNLDTQMWNDGILE